MEVRQINRSSSATRHPKVDTGAKSEYESWPLVNYLLTAVQQSYSNQTATLSAGTRSRRGKLNSESRAEGRPGGGTLRLITARHPADEQPYRSGFGELL